MERLPTVFLSSTFFDLRQVRSDLRDFVEMTLGYRLVASEFASFPMDPSLDTIENCRRRVEDAADIFVLIIGSRYGSVPAGHDRSITNIEYVAARSRGVPIFAFIHRDVLALLPVWEANPEADYRSVTDNPRLFEFVKQVRAHDCVWSFTFDTAQDIVATLKVQLAYQMQRGLTLLRAMHEDPQIGRLRGNALRVAAERPKAWQSLLLAELAEQALSENDRLLRDYETGHRALDGEHISDVEFFCWVASRSREAQRIGHAFESIMNDVLNTACRSGDVAAIAYTAARVAACQRESLEWSSRIRSAHVSPVVEAPALLLGKQVDRIVHQLQEFPEKLRAAVHTMLETGATSGRLSITLEMDDGLIAAFDDALQKAADTVMRDSGTA